MMRRFNRIMLVLAWLVAPLAALGLLAPFLASRWLYWDMLSHFALHSALYLAALVLASLLRRHFVPLFIAAGLIGAGGAFGLPLALQLAPQSAVFPHGGFKVLSFNLHGWANTELAPIEAMLRAQQADIVLLLEFTAQQKPLLQALRTLYLHQAECSEAGLCRMALLSRHPLRQTTLTARDYLKQAPAMANAVVVLPGGPVRIIGTHITRPMDPYGQYTQLGFVAALAQKAQDQASKLPVIAMGDFNAVPWSFNVRAFQAKSSLSCLNQYTPTWPMQPVGLAQFPIDQICVSSGLKPLGFQALSAAGSDHRPVTARLER